jgi:hypothetical protein
MVAATSVQHVASASGAMLASHLLTTRPDGALVGMDVIASVTALCAARVPFLTGAIETRVKQRESRERAAAQLVRGSAAA